MPLSIEYFRMNELGNYYPIKLLSWSGRDFGMIRSKIFFITLGLKDT